MCSGGHCYKIGLSNIELERMEDLSVYDRYVTAPILSDAITLNGLYHLSHPSVKRLTENPTKLHDSLRSRKLKTTVSAI